MLLRSGSLSADQKPLLSAIVRRHFDLNREPEMITLDNWQAVASQAPDKNEIPGKVRYLLRYIVWKDINGLRKSLANRILATIGRGPKRKSSH